MLHLNIAFLALIAVLEVDVMIPGTQMSLPTRLLYKSLIITGFSSEWTWIWNLALGSSSSSSAS